MADTSNTIISEAQKRAQEIAAKLTAGAFSNGGDDNNRKRPLEDNYGIDGPETKKLPSDGTVPPGTQPASSNAKAIAQAAISKIAGQLGLAASMTIEIKIPNRMVGLVIGRQGEMINKLQAESGARIQVAPDGSEINGERQVSISGSPETVERAKSYVNKVIEDAGGVTSVVSQMNLEPGQEIVELMIPANKVGLIIGKGGEMIKMLQERAGCKMQMIQDGPYAATPEKPLRMTGFPENCKKARQLVLELMEQKELEARGLTGDLGDLSQGIPDTLEIQVPKALVGFIIGRNGENIVNIQNTCNVRLQFQNDIPGTPFRVATIAGDPMNCQRAKAMVEEMVNERQQSGIKPRIELPDPQGPSVQTVGFPIPANKCGLIIGKGGDTIRQLMVQSSCHIELDRGPSPNPHEKIFNIRGNPQQIQLAQQLIRQKCDGEGMPGIYPGQPLPGMPFQGPGAPMYQQPAGFQPGQPPMGGPPNPWGQYAAYGAGGGYPGYGTTPAQQQPQAQQQQPSNAEAAQAWAAYYQQLQAYTQQQQQQQQQPGGGAATGNPPTAQGQQAATQPAQQRPQGQATPTNATNTAATAGAQPADLQAQWAEYYRQMGYYYQQQQQIGGAQQQGTAPAGEQKQLLVFVAMDTGNDMPHNGSPNTLLFALVSSDLMTPLFA